MHAFATPIRCWCETVPLYQSQCHSWVRRPASGTSIAEGRESRDGMFQQVEDKMHESVCHKGWARRTVLLPLLLFRAVGLTFAVVHTDRPHKPLASGGELAVLFRQQLQGSCQKIEPLYAQNRSFSWNKIGVSYVHHTPGHCSLHCLAASCCAALVHYHLSNRSLSVATLPHSLHDFHTDRIVISTCANSLSSPATLRC